MLLFEPPPSQADIHFRLFGFPVRVHPLFWLSTALLGVTGGDRGTPPVELALWIAVVFVSILVHELGHAFVQRRFGGRPWITLHGFGGLASCNDCDRSPRSQILISLAGPAAGFLFVLLVAVALRLAGRSIGWAGELQTPEGVLAIPLLGRVLYWTPFESWQANLLLFNILWVNVFWGLINLLPVYPLDGGQVARELFLLGNPRQGIVYSLALSAVTGGAAAIWVLVNWRSIFTAAMFGYLAYVSYQTLQAYRANRW
ncbi:MAG: hypothetical protein DCC67_12155 [Planctomycetota bacterium]|nr:MAG: hypothetical protein DCC67_12155 [Planctomycetota bacterium]